jgi:hypothetical protein
MYCLCVNVYCTTATGCQPNCSQQICQYQKTLSGVHKIQPVYQSLRKMNPSSFPYGPINIHFKNNLSPLWCPWKRKLSRAILIDADFLCSKTAMQRDVDKKNSARFYLFYFIFYFYLFIYLYIFFYRFVLPTCHSYTQRQQHVNEDKIQYSWIRAS